MLTEEQKQTILNSLWIVNTVLKELNLTFDEDLRQSAILCMIESVSRFDESRGVKWTTYAFATVKLFTYRELRKTQEYNAVFVLSGEDSERASDENDSAYIYSAIIDECDEEEKQIIELMYLGYKQYEIADRLKKSEYKVCKTVRSIRRKAKKVVEE